MKRIELKIWLLGFFYVRVPQGAYARWWFALAYRDYAQLSSVMVMWPFHYAVRLVHCLGWQWDRYRHRESWIDRQIKAALDRERGDRFEIRSHADADAAMKNALRYIGRHGDGS